MECRKCFMFTWILEKFASCVHSELESPAFVVDTLDKTKWSLRIYLNDFQENISFYLNRMPNSKGPDRIEIDYELAFLAEDGSILKSSVMKRRSFKRNDCYGKLVFETCKNVFDQYPSMFLPGGTLTACCRIWKSIGDVKMNGYGISRTRLAMERRCFSWETENFSAFKEKKENFPIRCASSDKPVVFLNMFVQQDINKKAENVHIVIQSASGTKVFFTLKITLLGAKRNPVDFGQYEVRFNSLDLKHEVTLPLTRDALIANSQMYLPNDVLTLLCDCEFSTGGIWKGIESISYEFDTECVNSLTANKVFAQNAVISSVETSKGSLTPPTAAGVEILHLKEDIIRMLNENIQCDVKLSAGTETFPAHWFILSARSPVFRAMFKSNMKEKSRDRIDIKDLNSDTVRRLLHYMYTDTLEELQWETASALYAASDKYQILALKDKCSTFLKTNLCPTNACELLILADLHHDKDLKSLVQNFILKHDYVDIINSDDWKDLMETNARLAAETMFLKFKK